MFSLAYRFIIEFHVLTFGSHLVNFFQTLNICSRIMVVLSSHSSYGIDILDNQKSFNKKLLTRPPMVQVVENINVASVYAEKYFIFQISYAVLALIENVKGQS